MFSNLKALTKVFLIIGVIAVIFIGFYSLAGFYSDYKTNKVLAKVEKLEAEKKALEDKKTSLEMDVKRLLEKQALRESEIIQLRELISRNEKSLIDEQNKIKKVVEEYEKNLNDIDANIDSFQRCTRLCQNRARLNYPCSANFCDQFKSTRPE